MTSSIEPLLAEHRELIPGIDLLRATADRVGELPYERLDDDVDDCIAFLVGHLLPHANAEDKVLYPMVARVMGAPDATATMERDHLEVDHLVHELVELRRRLAHDGFTKELGRSLRRVLYGLHTLVSVHFAKEEHVYVPLLVRALSPEQMSRLLAAMEAGAAPPELRLGELVRLSFTTDGDHTRADAIVSVGGRRYHGWGRARRQPTDPSVPRIGEELAASRALADLAHQLLHAASADIEAFEGRPVALKG